MFPIRSVDTIFPRMKKARVYTFYFIKIFYKDSKHSNDWSKNISMLQNELISNSAIFRNFIENITFLLFQSNFIAPHFLTNDIHIYFHLATKGS